jgi:hypothetical protein
MKKKIGGLFAAALAFGVIGCGSAADTCTAEAACAAPSTKKYQACCDPGGTNCYFLVGGTKITYNKSDAQDTAKKFSDACK